MGLPIRRVKQAEIDFGAGANMKNFTIIDPDVSSHGGVVAAILRKSPSDGRSIDEIDWESERMSVTTRPLDGSFELLAKTILPGMLFGKFVIGYSV